MSRTKSWMEDYIDALAALMVVASCGKYEHEQMADTARQCMNEVGYDLTEFSVDYLVGVSMEHDW